MHFIPEFEHADGEWIEAMERGEKELYTEEEKKELEEVAPEIAMERKRRRI
jgi:hypothetical protein